MALEVLAFKLPAQWDNAAANFASFKNKGDLWAQFQLSMVFFVPVVYQSSSLWLTVPNNPYLSHAESWCSPWLHPPSETAYLTPGWPLETVGGLLWCRKSCVSDMTILQISSHIYITQSRKNCSRVFSIKLDLLPYSHALSLEGFRKIWYLW